MATSSTLPSLPVELLYKISEQLSYGSHIALSFVCQELYAKLNTRHRLSASSPQGKAYTMDDLLEIENWPEYNPRQPIPGPYLFQPYLFQHIACRICLKLLRRNKFSRRFEKYSLHEQMILEDSKVMVKKRRQGQVCISCTIANKLPEYTAPDEFYINEGAVNLGLRLCGRCEKYFPRLLLIKDNCICRCCGDIIEVELRE